MFVSTLAKESNLSKQDEDELMKLINKMDESYNFTWEKGKTYTHEFKENLMTSCSIMVGLINDNSPKDIQNQVIVRINSDGEITYSYPETNTSV